QAAVGEEGAVHQAAVLLHREEQLARHHVAFGRTPDVPTHRLAGSELIHRTDQPGFDFRRHAPHASAATGCGCYELLTGPGALTPGVVKDQRAACLGVGVPDVLPREVGVPGRRHELEEPAGAAGTVDGQRVVVAFAVGNPQGPAEARTVGEDGVDGG